MLKQEILASNPLYQWRMKHTPPLSRLRLMRDLWVTEATIWLWEHGERYPRPDSFEQIRNVTQITKEQWDQWLASISPKAEPSTTSPTPTPTASAKS